MNQEKIQLYVDRDFGETFNASLKFLKQNFKLFFQSLLFISGPFLIVSGIAGAYYQAAALQTISMARVGSISAGGQYGIAYFVFILLSIAAQLTLIGTAYAYIITYNEKGPGNFTVSDVRKTLAKNIGGIIGVFFAQILYIVLATIVLVGVGFIFSSISSVLVGIYIFFTVIGLLIIGPPIAWLLNTVYLIKMQEGINTLFAFGRAKEILRGNFWWTWLIVVCSMIIVMIVSYIFLLPQIIYYIVLMMGAMRGETDTELSIPFIIITTVCTFFSTMLYSILFLINGFHYYSLAEKKDRKGLINRIDEIGNAPTNDVEQHY